MHRGRQRWAKASVTINGIGAPVSYVNPGEINAQIPYETALGLARIVVTVDGRASATVVLPISPATPGVFYSSETQSAVQNMDFSTNTSGNPVMPGGIIIAYATGQGISRCGSSVRKGCTQ
jgi:uncharacterized protein (TIGR03437 family)